LTESKKRYAPPTLTVHGDVTEITKLNAGGFVTDVPLGGPVLFTT
jgi:hypothetical protein